MPTPTPTPAPTATATATATATHQGAASLLRVLALLATPLGLSIPFDASCLWVSASAWAAFAMLAGLVQAAPLLAGSLGWAPAKAWTVGAVGAASTALFWLLVALPEVSSNTGFTLTVAAAAAVAGSLLAPGRRW